MPSYVPNLLDSEWQNRKKILIILHQEASTPGRIGHWLVKNGYALDVRRPRFGDPLPKTMDEHEGAMIFGGPMSSNDKDDFVRQEIDWIDVPLKENKPFLGICLGAQMLSQNMGAKVRSHPEGHVEIGYYPLHPTTEGQSLMQWPSFVYQWHREDAELPCDATLLATNNNHPCQAFCVGSKAFGIQFHPEVNLAMMNKWTVKGAQRMSMQGACGRADHFAGRALYDGIIRHWLDNFLKIWFQ